MSLPPLSPETIMQLAEASAVVSVACACARQPHASWESQSTSFPEELLQPLGRVASEADEEPTVREHHPHGTNLWSPDAPIALNYYPANRSEIWQCRQCSRCYLRYTEYGGYYVDRRIRALQPALITLAPAGTED
ncbi:hypothetical protein SAMN06265795_11666 [Noviherbaspirillum humi]|uniref:Uncharacterized protein n=1 Tax=Noviherbaspirillum humi TaxID=1688639 RepID=A0A239KM79_9BURK|nr:hypothetical protein [Noviherbaspirillum humi]SNT18832.1 hypothetical protein SAMN06265795_11666 [Noviherbaspirillum humi]